jgi:hypothetical protein
MVKIVNWLKAGGLYVALVFALYGNKPLIADSTTPSPYGRGGAYSQERLRQISLAPSRSSDMGMRDLTRSVSTFGSEQASLARLPLGTGTQTTVTGGFSA